MTGAPDVPPIPLRAVEAPPAKSPRRKYPAIAVYTGLRQVVDGGATFHILLCINDTDDQPQPFFVFDRGPRSVVEATSIRCNVCRKGHPLVGVLEALELWGGGKQDGFNVELDYDGGHSGICLDLRFLVTNWIRGLEARGKGGEGMKGMTATQAKPDQQFEDLYESVDRLKERTQAIQRLQAFRGDAVGDEESGGELDLRERDVAIAVSSILGEIANLAQDAQDAAEEIHRRTHR